MLHPSISVQSDDDDEVMSVNANSSSFANFKIPSAGPSLGADMLINKRKVSSDVLSVSSRSLGSASGSESEYSTDSEPNVAPVYMNSKAHAHTMSTGDDDDSDDYDDDDSIPNTPVKPAFGGQDVMANRMAAERSRIEAEMNEKKEILYQMDRLETKGYRLPKKFTLQSDIEEMRIEYNRILREKEVDASVRFQRKMMMAFVTGVEYVNMKFNPFDIYLDGWSEQVHETINDYDDIFEELHDKYQGTGKKMAPEMRLLLSLSGSAFMFNLTNNMFKQSKVPDVEEVIRSDPNLMKQFQQAAMNKVMSQPPSQSGGGMGLFSMVGNLFGLGGGRPTMPTPMPQQPQYNRGGMQPKMRGPRDIEDIIDDVSANISSIPPNNANRFETLSVSDEEITSIIEDTADINGLMVGTSKRRGGGKPRATPANKRTLQL